MSPANEVQVRDAEMDHLPPETTADRPARPPESAEHAFWSWLGFWVQILILLVLAVIGAFAASGADHSGEYECGVILSLGAIALAFLRLKQRLDGGSSGLADILFVEDMWNLALIVPLFTVLALAGLFIAHAWETGAMHAAGLALFVASGAFIFLDLKHVFDRLEARGRH